MNKNLKLTDCDDNYYREVGQIAAMNIFTRQKLVKKQKKCMSPQMKRVCSPENELKVLKDHVTRDISHLRDRVVSPSPKISTLPVDLNTIQKMLFSSGNGANPFFPAFLNSFKGKQYENMWEKRNSLSLKEFHLEKKNLGMPSGRQECENLKFWLENMKKMHCGDNIYDENGIVIYKMCGKELLRQVYVGCVERGELLQETLSFFIEISEKFEKDLKNIILSNETLVKTLEKEFSCKLKELNKKISEVEKEEKRCKFVLDRKILRISRLKQRIQEQSEDLARLNEKYSEKIENKILFKHLIKRTSSNYTITGIVERKVLETERGLFGIHEFGISNNDFDEESEREGEKIKEIAEKNTQTDQILCEFETFQIGIPEKTLKNIDLPVEPIVKVRPPRPGNINIVRNIGFITEESENFPKSPKKAKFDPKTPKLGKKTPNQFLQEPRSSLFKFTKKTKKEAQSEYKLLQIKIAEKGSELEKTLQKISEKQAELDFLSKTLDYKKLQFNPAHSNHEIVLKKQVFDKDFGILSDNNYWEDVEVVERSLLKPQTIVNMPSNSRNEMSNTDLGLDSYFADLFIDEKYSDIEANSAAEESFSANSIKNLQNRFSEYTFYKNTPMPLHNLWQLYDLNLYKSLKPSKQTPAQRILEKICEKTQSWIKSKSTLSRKHIHKQIFSIYLSFYSRNDYSENFLDYVYYDFQYKYGLKLISDQRFVEFICSLISFESSRRCAVFLRFIFAGQKIKRKNYSKESFELFLESFANVLNSKMIGKVEEIRGKICIPFGKAGELVRDKLGGAGAGVIEKTMNIIEFKTVEDPNKISSNGVVDCEIVLELIIESIERLKYTYLEGLQYLLNVIKYKEQKESILKFEVSMIIRAIHPVSLSKFENFYENTHVVSLQELCLYAIENKLFSIADVKVFYSDEEKSSEEAEGFISETIEKMSKTIEEIGNTDQLMRTVPRPIWDLKMKNIRKGIRNTHETLFALKVFSLELTRVHSTFL